MPAASADSRLIELGRQWLEARARGDAAHAAYDENAAGAELSEMLRLEAAMAEVPAAALAGVAVKACAMDPDSHQDELLRSIKDDVLRLAGEIA